MIHRSLAAKTSSKRIALTLAVSAALSLGSPLVAISSAQAGGAQKPVTAGFGDCKNDNSGKHLGYVCPTPDTSGGSGGGIIS